jgi:hypothetical protein
MQFLALVEAIAAGLTPANVASYIDLVEKLIAVAQSIESAASKSQNPPQNGSAQS